MIGNTIAALARQIAEAAKQQNRSGPPSGPIPPGGLAALSDRELAALPAKAVTADPEAFRRWSYLKRGEEPPEPKPAPESTDGAASRSAQRQETGGGIGRAAAALAMGANPAPQQSQGGDDPFSLPIDELRRRFTQTVGKHAMRPKGEPGQLEANRELRTLAAAVRRRSPRGSRHRQSARDAAVAVRPTPDERRQWAARQPAASQPSPAQDRSNQEQRHRSGFGFLDGLQTTLDAVGVVDPTPAADWTNTGISLTRAALDKERRGEHLQNAGISAVSGAVPYLGDTAKLLKVPRLMRRAGGGAKAAKATPSAGERLTGSVIGMAFGPAARTQWNASRKRRRDAAASGGGGGRGNGPRVTTGAGGPGDDDGNRSPFSWFAGWGKTGSPRQEGQQDAARGRRELNKALKEFTDKIKDGAKGLTKLTVGAIAAVEGLRLVNSGIIAYNRDLARFNGQLAVAYGKARAADIRRSIRGGKAVAEPLSNLVEGQSRLQDLRQQFSDPVKQVSLTVQEKLTNAAATFLEAANKITGASNTLQTGANAITAAMNFDLKAIYEAFKGDVDDSNNPDTVFREFLKDVGDGKFDGPKPKFDNRRPGKRIGDGLKNMPLR